jgi:hypothetical protein
MSHFACPLCGKNAPISTYRPEELDLDLQVVQYGSRGRGGIYVACKNSILGEDDELNSLVASRSLKIVEMFIDASVLTKDEVRRQLGLDQPNNSMIVQLMGERDKYMRWAISAEDELDEMRKKEEQDKNIRRLLHELAELCKCEAKFNDDHEPTVWVEEIEPDYTKLIEWFTSLRIEDQTKLLSKVKTESSMIEAILNALARFPKRKKTQEELMEFTLFPRRGN